MSYCCGLSEPGHTVDSRDKSLTTMQRQDLLVWTCSEVIKVKLPHAHLKEAQQEVNRGHERNHNHANCVWFPASCYELSLSAAQTELFNPPPHTHTAQMVLIEGLHDWAAATHQILRSDSLLSLNTPD